MDFEPPLYHLKLSEVRRYKKSMLKNHETLYFEVNKRLLIFYDKKEEAPNDVIPPDLIFNNLLRYEFRLLSRKSISKQLGKTNVKMKDLYNKRFYKILLNKYKEEYFKVITNPNPILTIKPNVKANVKLLTDLLSMHGINQLGGVNEVIAMIDKLCKQHNIKGTSKQRLKAKLYQIADNKELLDTDDLIEELSRKVKRSVEFML